MKPKDKAIANFTFVLLMVTATGAISFSSTSYAQNEFDAELVGQDEVPPVQTHAKGTAIFYPMGDSLHFIVSVTNIQGVTSGHVHSGSQGENGPVVATLFNFDSPQNGVNMEDMIGPAGLVGPMQGKQTADLIREMNDGNTYVNIHTAKNPNGEIRGQITGFAEHRLQ